ncbi:alpha/beta hydrolase [Novosphingobium flavum]|uniref:Alpha/beta hydrolase n=1 Tax=Novosphingobium flavum TaxID=1778672 RepID=A0A7X1FT63_9SPHN|nr:alpha/beta hydrolase [Novosphingobium flavum]MBC2666529.1 alpha/beta hydrolase [Novosphingobium flavum]
MQMTKLKARMICAAAGFALWAPGSAAIAKAQQPQAHQVIPLYQGAAPGTEGWTQKETAIDLEGKRFNPPNPDTLIVNVTTPTLTVFRPAAGKANGAAVIVAPGGGFRVLSFKNEGLRVAQWLADRGITAFVLKYRLNPMPTTAGGIMQGMDEMMRAAAARPGAAAPTGAGAPPPGLTMGPIENGAISDGQQAIKYVRSHAAQYGVNPAKIGIIGFSAGGAVSSGATIRAAAADKPNFVGIIYAFAPDELSPGLPPAFMAGAADDPLAARIPALFTNWLATGAKAELHIYAKGQHGFGTARQNLPVDGWLGVFHAWLGQQGFIPSTYAH